MAARVIVHAHQLPADIAAAIREHRRTHGEEPTATLFRASQHTIEKLASGIGATRQARDRIEARARELIEEGVIERPVGYVGRAPVSPGIARAEPKSAPKIGRTRRGRGIGIGPSDRSSDHPDQLDWNPIEVDEDFTPGEIANLRRGAF